MPSASIPPSACFIPCVASGPRARHGSSGSRGTQPLARSRGAGPGSFRRPGTDTALALGVMHVLIREDRVDHAYIARSTLGYERLAEHVAQYAPERVAPIVGLPASTIVDFARRYGASPRSFMRVGIGVSRHENGGMTCRTLACLPALTGAYADDHGGALLSSTGGFGFDSRVLERSDLMPSPSPRVINMIHLGRVLTDPVMTP